MAKRRKTTNKIRELVVAAHEDDPRPYKIAKEHDIHHSVVLRILKEEGVELDAGRTAGAPPGLTGSLTNIEGASLEDLLDEAEEVYSRIALSPSKIRSASPREAASAVAALLELAAGAREVEDGEIYDPYRLASWSRWVCELSHPALHSDEKLKELQKKDEEYLETLRKIADEEGIPVEELDEWRWIHCDPSHLRARRTAR